MKNSQTLLNSEPLQIKDLANLVLVSILFSLFFQFSSLPHHSFLPKEEKEVNEKLEKEESRLRISASVINKKTGGDSGNGHSFFNIQLSCHSFNNYNFVLLDNSTNNFYNNIKAFKIALYILFSQIVVYNSI